MSPPWDSGPTRPRDAASGGDGPDAIITAPQAARSRPTCGPADGPAWTFEILVVPRTFACNETFTDERIVLEVVGDLDPSALPRTFDVGGGVGGSAGTAAHCDGTMCNFAERGTIEILAFDPPAEGLLRYQMELPTGEVFGSDASVPIHCESLGGCG